MYDQLHRDHLEILEIVAEVRARTAEETLSDSTGLARCRWRLARTVTQHLALEDVQVYPLLFTDPRPEATALAARFERELCHLLSAFNTHTAEWTSDAVRRDWQGYRAAINELLDALETRIRLEESELYPLFSEESLRAA